MKIKFIAYVLIIIYNLSSNLNAQDSWQQFRGNNRNGSSIDSIINENWINKEPALVWKKNIGSGFSEIVVSQGEIFTMISEKIDSTSGSEFLAVYNEKTGNEIWKTLVDSMYFDISGNGPRSTPSVDDKTVFCLSSFGKLNAISRVNGKVLWTRNLMTEFDSTNHEWVYTSSPILCEDELIIEVGGKGSKGFASFDKKTGDILWIKGVGKPSYCSPTFAKIDEVTQIIFANDTMLFSFDKEGNELWSYRMPLKSPVAMPLFIAPNKIFISSGAGCFMIKIQKSEVTEIFSQSTMRNMFSTSCYFNGHIYGVGRRKLNCISAIDGVEKWSEKGFGLGSLILVGNKLIVLTDKGVLKIVEAIPDVYSEISSFQALEDKSYTAPSFANGKIYLRNLTEMAVYKLN
jgi:outer membrane protein assembly factor BamB